MKKIVLVFMLLALLVTPVAAMAGAPGTNDPARSFPGNVSSSVAAAEDPAGCPAGKQVINMTQKVVNDSSGYQSYWNDLNGLTFAMLDYNRLIKVWEIGPGSYCAQASYTGTFVTIGGGSPGGTDPSIAAGIKGNFNGSYVATFNLTLNPSPVWSQNGNIGTIDYACVASPDAFDCPGYVNWVEAYFIGYPGNFDYTSHDYQFRTPKNGTFIQHLNTFEGDITD